VPKDPHPAPDLFSWDDRSGRQSGGWSNKLIWGDNKLVLASLKNGPLRKEIEDAGGLKLVYIDPPFDVGADFSFDVDVGGRQVLQKAPSIIEEVAYRDTWGRGPDSYLMMMNERLRITADLLQERAIIYVHVGKSVAHMVRCLCDEMFARDFCVNEITWKRSHAHGDTGQGAKHFGRVTESILVYKKSESCTWTPQYSEYTESILDRDYKYIDNVTGERYRLMPVDGPGGASKGNPYYEFLGVKGY
jgi:adenine-specific DNA-methyltransferase